MSEPRIAYTVRNDVNLESEIGALTAVYSFILKNHQTLRNTEEVSDVERSNRHLAVEAIHRPRKGKHGRND